LEMEGSPKLFAWSGLKPQPSQSQPPKLATITGMSHRHPAPFSFLKECQESVFVLEVGVFFPSLPVELPLM
jgi:hypothetical protein